LIYGYLDATISYNETQCQQIYSYNNTVESTFYDSKTYACGPVPDNRDGSYLTMISGGGLMFGIINIVGNFGTVFVDQSYWQSAIAARPESAAKGYLLGGVCWFAIPFSLATSLGLASTALMLPITAGEAGSGLVPPAVAQYLLGDVGAVLILIMLFMAIVSTGSAESIAVSSLVSYDIYREYINPEATGQQILFVSRVVIVLYGLFMGALAIALQEIGLNLGWVYLFMGIVIGSAVVPLWNLMTWKKASGKGAVIAAISGLCLALASWMIGAQLQSGEITVASLGSNEVMLTGNLFAIISSGLIHFGYSTWIDPQDYDFSQLDAAIQLVEDDTRGLTAEEQDETMLRRAETWITRRGYILTVVLIIVWPLLSIPAGVFTRSYFAFWVLVAIGWGFGAALIITFLPLIESSEEILKALSGIFYAVTGKTPPEQTDPALEKKLDDDEPAAPEAPQVAVKDLDDDNDDI